MKDICLILVMMMLLYILLLYSCVFVYGQNQTCSICVVGSTCTDDDVHFNISVSEACIVPMDIYYSYDTDIDSVKQYSNATIDCQGCYFDLTIDAIRDAWVYTLTLDSPLTTELCSSYSAKCGGKGSWLLWIITGGLSGIFILSGAILCVVRCYRSHQYVKNTNKRIDAAIINS